MQTRGGGYPRWPVANCLLLLFRSYLATFRRPQPEDLATRGQQRRDPKLGFVAHRHIRLYSNPMTAKSSGPDHRSDALDLAPPSRGDAFCPSWLRTLVWVDGASKYDAFLSYSWKCDRDIAPVIQSLLQNFLRPWHKVRAKTVFRDLSSLPAGSSLEAELFDRLDHPEHLIILASPDAAASRGMEMEASHWFSRGRSGEVLIVITAGDDRDWQMIRDHLVPPSIRIERRMQRWLLVAKYPSIDPRCPPSRARRNFWRLIKSHPKIASRLSLTAVCVYER
jgi:hypothetical protein